MKHVDSWIFDLDNTLYPAACDLFSQVSVRMGEYVSRFLSIHVDDARHVQKVFFREFGTTMNGMMQVYGMAPGPFLDYVHDIDVSVVPPSPRLDAALGRLPGRKLIFTNGTVRHAENVLGRLGITHHFTEIFDIVAADYTPKPEPAPYDQLIARYGVAPARAAMFEDIARNLEPAHALGMTTVWVPTADSWSRAGSDGDHIDHVAPDLTAFLETIAQPGE